MNDKVLEEVDRFKQLVSIQTKDRTSLKERLEAQTIAVTLGHDKATVLWKKKAVSLSTNQTSFQYCSIDVRAVETDRGSGETNPSL